MGMLLSYIRDFVPPFYFGLAVTLWRGRYADAVASSTAPRVLVVLAVRLFMTCSRLISYAVYKESALFLGISFWLHQGRIPRHTCRFYLLLAGHAERKFVAHFFSVAGDLPFECGKLFKEV